MSRVTICMVVITMLLAMGLSLAQEGLEEQCWYDRICMSGFFRIQYLDTDAPGAHDNFDVRDLYLTFQGDIDARSRGIITFARVGPNDPDVTIYNLFVDYSMSDQYKVQIGQVPTWFGLEAWEGSSVRLPFERAKILEGTAAGFGMWWQGASDRGVWFRRMPTPGSSCEPMLIAGVSNGQFRSDDENDDKNIDAHLKWMKDWGQFGLSWMDGTYVDGQSVETERSMWDAYVRLHPNTVVGPIGLQFEYADGELLGADRDGWYGQAVYDFGNTKDRAYLRYEEFNADVDAANMAEFTGWTVGWAHQVYDSSQITLEWRQGDWDRMGTVDGQTGSNDEDWIGAQWQYSFR